jgi:hypothetical protein
VLVAEDCSNQFPHHPRTSGAGIMVAKQLPSLIYPFLRTVRLYASIVSFVVGLMVLIPLGLVLSPLVLAYSRLGFSKTWTSAAA